MEAWTKHITGAASLLELRGIDQLRTPMGHHLFIHLRTQVVSKVLCSYRTLLTCSDHKLHTKTCTNPSHN